MSEYLERETVVNIADHAILEHPYDKDPQRPETYSDYNQGWSDACEHIRARYPVRPMICRLMGVCDGLECPEGNSAHIDGLKFFDPGTDGDTRLLNALDWGYRGESK